MQCQVNSGSRFFFVFFLTGAASATVCFACRFILRRASNGLLGTYDAFSIDSVRYPTPSATRSCQESRVVCLAVLRGTRMTRHPTRTNQTELIPRGKDILRHGWSRAPKYEYEKNDTHCDNSSPLVAVYS
eukprot:scaffold579_cov37-Prasinocladus_malaysianus.AAC.1